MEITFVEVDSVGGIFGERECYDTRMQFRGVVALLDTGDIGRLPCGIVAGIPSLAAGHTAAAGVDRGLFDDIEAVSVAKVVQRTGYAACRKQNQGVPLLFPFGTFARPYGTPHVGYGPACFPLPV